MEKLDGNAINTVEVIKGEKAIENIEKKPRMELYY